LANNRITGKAIRPLREQHSGTGKQLLSSLLRRHQLSTTNNFVCDYWLLVGPEGQRLIISRWSLALQALELADVDIQDMVVYQTCGFSVGVGVCIEAHDHACAGATAAVFQLTHFHESIAHKGCSPVVPLRQTVQRANRRKPCPEPIFFCQ
jgi:hypothetical protein